MKKTIITSITIIIVLAFSPRILIAGYYEQGRAYFTHKKYEKAKEMFLKATQTTDSGDPFYFLGEIEKLQGNYKEAEDYYKSAIAKKRVSRQYLINSYWNAIVLTEQREDYPAVIKLCREMKEKTGDAGAKQKAESLIGKFLWTDNKDAIDKYNEGIDLKKSRKQAEALKKFQEALGLAPSFLAAKFEIGMIAFNKGELDVTTQYLGSIAARLPFYAEVQLILADIYFSKHQYGSAIEYFNNALEYGFMEAAAENRTRVKRGTCYYNIKNFEAAEGDIEKALSQDASSVEALLLLSAVRIKMGKLPEALKTLQRAYSAHPKDPNVLYQIGSIYYKENNPEYVTYFEKLFEIAGGEKNHSPKYNKVFIMLARHYYGDKKYGRALSVLKTLEEKAQTYESRLIAARASYQLKEYEEAIDYFEKLSLANEDKLILCKAYALSGRREKAKMILSEVMYSSEYAAKARQDPTLAGIAKEIEKDKPTLKPAPEKESDQKNRESNKQVEKSIPPPRDSISEDEEE